MTSPRAALPGKRAWSWYWWVTAVAPSYSRTWSQVVSCFCFHCSFFSFFRAWICCSQSHKNPLFLISLNILNSWRIPCLSIKAFSNLVDHQRKANDRQLGVPEVLAIVGVALDWKHEQNLGDSYPFIWSGKIRGGVAPGFTTKKIIPHFFQHPCCMVPSMWFHPLQSHGFCGVFNIKGSDLK